MLGIKSREKRKALKAYTLGCAALELDTATGLLDNAVFDLECSGGDGDNLLECAFTVALLMVKNNVTTLKLNDQKTLTIDGKYLKISTVNQ